jgi:hypothetical protein
MGKSNQSLSEDLFSRVSRVVFSRMRQVMFMLLPLVLVAS